MPSEDLQSERDRLEAESVRIELRIQEINRLLTPPRKGHWVLELGWNPIHICIQE